MTARLRSRETLRDGLRASSASKISRMSGLGSSHLRTTGGSAGTSVQAARREAPGERLNRNRTKARLACERVKRCERQRRQQDQRPTREKGAGTLWPRDAEGARRAVIASPSANLPGCLTCAPCGPAPADAAQGFALPPVGQRDQCGRRLATAPFQERRSWYWQMAFTFKRTTQRRERQVTRIGGAALSGNLKHSLQRRWARARKARRLPAAEEEGRVPHSQAQNVGSRS